MAAADWLLVAVLVGFVKSAEEIEFSRLRHDSHLENLVSGKFCI